jgi:hypothetical protein
MLLPTHLLTNKLLAEPAELKTQLVHPLAVDGLKRFVGKGFYHRLLRI